MVTLRCFAQAREACGHGSVEIEGSTVGEVLGAAEVRFGPEFAAIVAASRVWLDGAPAEPSDPVGPGQEVAVLPPVSGG